MWEISIWFVAFLFAINGMLVWVADAAVGYDLISPFSNQTYTPPPLPSVNNTIGNLTTTTTVTNATSGGPAVGFWDAANFIYNGGSWFVQFLYGSVTGSFFISMGMPGDFLAILYGLELFFLIITTLHIFTGRF